MIKLFNPIEQAKNAEEIVMSEGCRKYYRFRYARYYGGIITADAVGCNLLCYYCWNRNRNLEPEKHGMFFSPKEVAEELTELANKHNVDLYRISGAEPVLGNKSMEHLVEVIKMIPNGQWIIETNGIMLGQMPELCDLLYLSNLPIAVRVSIKGWDMPSFEQVTGAEGRFWHLQIEALRNLKEREIVAYPAVMYDLFRETGIQKIAKKLEISMDEIELEYLEVRK